MTDGKSCRQQPISSLVIECELIDSLLSLSARKLIAALPKQPRKELSLPISSARLPYMAKDLDKSIVSADIEYLFS